MRTRPGKIVLGKLYIEPDIGFKIRLVDVGEHFRIHLFGFGYLAHSQICRDQVIVTNTFYRFQLDTAPGLNGRFLEPGSNMQGARAIPVLHGGKRIQFRRTLFVVKRALLIIDETEEIAVKIMNLGIIRSQLHGALEIRFGVAPLHVNCGK